LIAILLVLLMNQTDFQQETWYESQNIHFKSPVLKQADVV